MRLIYAHDLWTEIMMLPHNGDMISSVEVEKAIVEAPTVDAVPVVRCVDCKNYCHIIGKGNTKLYGCSYMGRDVGQDCFCSHGERRDSDV